MKSLKITTLVLLAAFLLVRCGSGAQKQPESITISGAFALYPLAVKWAEEYKKLNPDLRIDISAGGAGKGLTDALSGAVTLGMFSRKIEQAEIDKGVWWVAVTKDAVLPVVSAKNPNVATLKQKGVTQEQFKKIFITQEIKTWGELLGTKDATKINVYTRSDASGAADSWASYLGKKQENLIGTGVFGDPGLADAVSKDPNGIGYNNTIFAYDLKTGQKQSTLEVLPIDINSNGSVEAEENFYGSFREIQTAIAQQKFPSPPARELYFVSKGKPQNAAAAAFLKWILTDGQKYIEENGFVQLPQELINQELNKLN